MVSSCRQYSCHQRCLELHPQQQRNFHHRCFPSMLRSGRIRISTIEFCSILLISWHYSTAQSFVWKRISSRRNPDNRIRFWHASQCRPVPPMLGSTLPTTDQNDTIIESNKNIRDQDQNKNECPTRYDETTDWNSVFSSIAAANEHGGGRRDEVPITRILKIIDEMNKTQNWKGVLRLLRWMEATATISNIQSQQKDDGSSSPSLFAIPHPDAEVYNKVVKCCVASGESYHALEVIKSMLTTLEPKSNHKQHITSRRVQALTESFQVTMSLLSRQRKWRQCLDLLDTMVIHDIPRSIATYNIVISVCARSQQVGMAKSLLSKMRNKDKIRPNEKTYATLIGACATPANWKDALVLLDQCYREPGVEPDIFIYTNAMRACAKGRNSQRALSILQVAKDKGLKLDAYAYTTVMEACGNSKKWYKSLELFREMESNGIQPTEVTYSVLINALGKGGQVDLALSMLDRMKREGLEPNLYTYNAAITALSKASRTATSSNTRKDGDLSVTALNLLEQMKQSGIQPDGFCYSSAIACCGADGRWVEACELIETMKQGGPSTRPNKVAYSAAISACGRAAESSKALELFEEMQSTGIGVDTVAYNAVFSALRVSNEADAAYKLWTEMCNTDDSTAARFRRERQGGGRGSRPDIITLQECISILSTAGRLDRMDEVFSDAVRSGIVLSNDSLDEEFEFDLSGMSLPVARAACRFVISRLLSSNSNSPGQELTFITGVGIAHQHPNKISSRSTRGPLSLSSSSSTKTQKSTTTDSATESDSIFEKNPETSLQDYCCGILVTDFVPPLSYSIPDRAPGTVAVKLPPSSGQALVVKIVT